MPKMHETVVCPCWIVTECVRLPLPWRERWRLVLLVSSHVLLLTAAAAAEGVQEQPRS